MRYTPPDIQLRAAVRARGLQGADEISTNLLSARPLFNRRINVPPLAERMRSGPVALAALAALGLASAALPPGYQDELYCPPMSCLRPKRGVPAGFTGPQVAFKECFHSLSKHGDTSAPKPWGFKVGEEVKQELLAAKYHLHKCTEAQAKEL